MLKQEELAFLKAMSTLEFSPALLRELRKAVAAKKRTKAVAPSRAKMSCVALIKHHPTISRAGTKVQSCNGPFAAEPRSVPFDPMMGARVSVFTPSLFRRIQVCVC